MKTRFQLPGKSNRKAVQEAMKYYFDCSTDEQRLHAYEWTRTHWYLQGIRRLNIVSQRGSQLPPPSYIDEQGQRRVRIELATGAIRTEMGRILSMDLGPVVPWQAGVTLEGLRQAAISNVVLDAFWRRFDSNSFRAALAYMLPAYGTAGIGAFDCSDSNGGVYGTTLMVIPPWELRPLPGGVSGIQQVAGVTWHRWVPWDWLKENYKDQLDMSPRGEDADDLMLVEAPAGVMVQGEMSPSLASGMMGVGPVPMVTVNKPNPSIQVAMGGKKTGKEKTLKFVNLKQSWVWGDDYSCLRQIIMLGNHLGRDSDWSNEKDRDEVGLKGNDLPIAPVHVARYLPVGSFWGRSLAEQIIPVNREVELGVGDLLQESRDIGRFTKLLVPTTSNINERTLESAQRNGILRYQPDYSGANIRPEIISPPTDRMALQGKAVGLMMSFFEKIAMQGPQYTGNPGGRTDSGSGVDALMKAQEIPMMALAESLEGAMTGAWKAVLAILGNRLTQDDSLLLSRVDESMLGLRLDRKTGKVSVADNPIPSPRLVNIMLRSKMPMSSAAKKERILEELKTGSISMVEYRIKCAKEGVGEGLLNLAEYHSWTSAWMDIISIFGDGQTPGEPIFQDAEVENHTICLMAVMQVIQSPLYRIASPDVRHSLREYKRYHEGSKGVPLDLMTLAEGGQPQPPGQDMSKLAAMEFPPNMQSSGPMEALPGLQ